MIPKPRFLGAGADSDERLVELIRLGDEHAFEQIVRRHRPALVAYCRRLGLRDARAEDAVQQAFLSAWLALRRGDEVRDLRAWLGRIAHNKAVNLLRAGNRSGQSASEPNAAGRSDIDEALAVRATLAAVAALPDRQRDALLLSAVDGRSYEEVADALGVSPGAVRGLLHRARATLRAATGALAPLGLLRRFSFPAGRAAELAGPGSAGGGTVRAAAAAVTTIALAAGVAVGPLHGLISQPAPHRGARAGSDHEGAPARRANDAASLAVTSASRADAAPAAARKLGAAAPVSSGAVSGSPSAGGEGGSYRSGRGGRPETEIGGGSAESGGEAGLSEPAAAVASSSSAPAEAPATSAPAPEPPPVASQPEAPRETETRERETQREDTTPVGEVPAPTEGTVRKDN